MPNVPFASVSLVMMDIVFNRVEMWPRHYSASFYQLLLSQESLLEMSDSPFLILMLRLALNFNDPIELGCVP